MQQLALQEQARDQPGRSPQLPVPSGHETRPRRPSGDVSRVGSNGSSDGLETFVDRLLNEQAALTAVERFSRLHDTVPTPPPAARYRHLLPATPPGPGRQYAFEVDLDRCSGCKSCVTACHSLNGLEEHETWRSVGLLISAPMADPGRASSPPPALFQQHVTTACHHCVDPACLNGCPVLAYDKDPLTGIVRHLDDQCIGCSYCIMKCPYEVPQFSRRLGIVRKCDLCQSRLAVNEPPACAQACPQEAIRITVVTTADITTAYRAAECKFLPDSPDPALTLPSTRYVGSPSGTPCESATPTPTPTRNLNPNPNRNPDPVPRGWSQGCIKLASSSPSSPCEERVGRGPRRGEANKNGPPLPACVAEAASARRRPGPLLHPMEEREKIRSLMQPQGWSRLRLRLRLGLGLGSVEEHGVGESEGWKFPGPAIAADHHLLRLDPPHWPLVIMLLLTQAAVGLFLASWAGSTLGNVPSSPLPIAGFGFLAAGLLAAVFHLGQPLKAWRAFLGWRTSWLSREIIAFNVLAGTAVLLLAQSFVPWLYAGKPWLESGVAFAGLGAVFTSAMVYIDTGRPMWAPRLVLGDFLGTTLLLGATFSAVIFAWSAHALDPGVVRASQVAAAAALLIRTVLFVWRRLEFRIALNDAVSPIHRNARAIRDLLPWTMPMRNVLFVASTLLGLLAVGNWAGTGAYWASLAAATTFSSEVIARYVFFVAGTGRRMPGGIHA